MDKRTRKEMPEGMPALDNRISRGPGFWHQAAAGSVDPTVRDEAGGGGAKRATTDAITCARLILL
jgi:hypothetical protein